MDDNIKYKTCTKCHENKPISDFLKHTGKCKSCRSAYTKEYKKINKEKIRVAKRLYRKTAKYKEKKKQYRIRHKEEIKIRQKNWYENNKEKLLFKHAEYRRKNAPFHWSREWYSNYKKISKDQYLKLLNKKRKYSKVQSEILSDRYISSLIKDNYKIKCKIPNELIESYRQQIKVKRLLKKKKDENTKAS